MRRAGEQGCWDRSPDGSAVRTGDAFDRFWHDLSQGSGCGRNWYTGNDGGLGQTNGGPTQSWVTPHFTSPHAPALLGFDENIDDYCGEQSGTQYSYEGHAQRCVRANVNILSIYGETIPYNVCRNLEWMTCAAMGRLPGQGEGRGGNILRFAKAPRNLEPRTGDRPIGACYGYHPAGCDKGYSSSDIFFLEACFYNQICSNAHELWMLSDGQDWICHVDQAGIDQVRDWMRAGLPREGAPRGRDSKGASARDT